VRKNNFEQGIMEPPATTTILAVVRHLHEFSDSFSGTSAVSVLRAESGIP
jgi:hypothetical protein